MGEENSLSCFEIKMKDSTIPVFFILLRAGLWGEEARLSQFENIDYAAILQLAEEQSVVGLATAGLEHVADVKVPQEWLLQFVGETLQIEQQNKDMNSFLCRLIEKMRTAGIYTLLVKGQGVAQCYEKPLWRACGDVDLFLSSDNYSKAKDLLIPLASEVEQEYVGAKHLGMTVDGWVVELHGTLHVGLSKRINRVLDDILRDTFYGGNVRSWNNNGTQVFLLGKENDVVYVFVHFLNHFYKGGIGLRQICDWCRLLWSFKDSLNYGLIESRIRKMGLMSEWKVFGAFAVEYIGMPVDAMPMFDPSFTFQDSRFKRKVERIKDFILMSGNFGHNRDMSYYSKYPIVIRKCCSMWMRVTDLYNHARIFPLDSLRFFPRIMWNGMRSAVRGEG